MNYDDNDDEVEDDTIPLHCMSISQIMAKRSCTSHDTPTDKHQHTQTYKYQFKAV